MCACVVCVCTHTICDMCTIIRFSEELCFPLSKFVERYGNGREDKYPRYRQRKGEGLESG